MKFYQKMTKLYNRAAVKRETEQQLKEYLHKNYGDCLIGEGMHLTPYCSEWVKDIVKTKNKLEKIVK
jgi:hypothetical protein